MVWALASVATATATAQAPPASSLSGVCGGSSAAITAPTGTTTTDALFTLHPNGRFEPSVRSEPRVVRGGKVVFRLAPEWPSTAVVRVESVHPSSGVTDGVVACGPVQPGQTAEFSVRITASERRTLRFLVFRALSHTEAARWDPERVASIAAVETSRAAEAYVALARHRVLGETALRTQITSRAPNWQSVAHALCGLLDDAYRLAPECGTPNPIRAAARLCGLAWTVPARSSLSYFETHLCDARDAMLDEIGSLHAAICTGDDPSVCMGSPPPPEVTSAFIRVLDSAREPVTDASAICGAVRHSRWLRTSGVQLAAVFETPLTEAPVMVATYDAGVRTRRDLVPSLPGGLIVTDVPSSQTDIVFRQRSADAALPDSLTGAVRLALRMVRSLGGAAPSGAPCETATPSFDLPVTPALATVGTRAATFAPLPTDRVTTVDVCAGRACVAEGAGANLRDSFRLTPVPVSGWAALVELGAAPLAVQLWPSVQWAYTTPAYRPAGGSQGPEQIFLLDQQADVASLFTLSALLGYTHRLSRDHRLLIAFAAVLADANGSRSFTELGVRVGFEVAPNIFLNTGLGLAYQRRVVEVDAREAIAVARAEGIVPEPPSLATSDAWVLRGVVGVAFDLAMFGDAANEIAGAVGRR